MPVRSASPGRIAVVTTSYPSRAGDASGHFVAAGVRELVALGHEVVVLAAGAAHPATGPDAPGGADVRWCGGAALFGWPGAAERARAAPWRLGALAPFALGFVRAARALGPLERVVAHWLVPGGWPLGTWLAERTGAPLELWAHGSDVRLLVALPARVRHALVATLVARAERICFAAHTTRTSLCQALPHGLAATLAARSEVRAPSLALAVRDADGARRAWRELGAGPAELRVVVAARLIAGKRPEMAVRALAAAGEGHFLLVLGDGPERAACEQLARTLGVRARFAGRIERSRALGLIATADVLVHPAAIDAAPSAVREARAYGVPVIAAPAGDVPRWAETDPGITLAGDAVELAALLQRVPRRRAPEPTAQKANAEALRVVLPR
ncbi:MAG: glycosyltransferase [Polyangiaceae bacterium]|nr:glycosyltransferase [Polyangiaceae bacterium]